jgi:hypothetical protein
MAEMQVGLPYESRRFDLRMRTGESEVDGRATQSIILVRKGCWQRLMWSHNRSPRRLEIRGCCQCRDACRTWSERSSVAKCQCKLVNWIGIRVWGSAAMSA